MLHRLITREYEQMLRRVRALLEHLHAPLGRLDAPTEDIDLLKRSLQQLDELFLLVVVGEFNAGKTAFLNALLGNKLLKEGVTPTTSHIHLLRYGEELDQKNLEDDVLLIHVPVDWLREINLVDTPGANAVIQRHQQITEHFVPRSDLVLFITSADRPFSESERLFLERIREWGKKIVIIVNKIDLFQNAAEQAEVLDYVRENARQLLDTQPEIFPVSARLALQAKQEAKAAGQDGTPTGATWEASGFGALESYILRTLDAAERIRLKLENPLGVAARLLDQYEAVIGDRQALLRGDFQALDSIESDLEAYQTDMRRDFVYQRSHVDNVLYSMIERGDTYFDETLRIGRIFDLVNAEKLRAEFERQVVGDTSREIEANVSSLIDWMVDKDFRQWKAVMEFMNRRATQHADRIVGQVGADFELNRQNMLKSVGREAHKVVNSYDREAESLKMAKQVQNAIIQTAAVEAGALGLGALMIALLQTSLLDVTGFLGAGAVAALGFYVLPYRRAKIKADLRVRVGELRQQLAVALERQFETELGRSTQRIREAIAPYTRFVRVEREKLEQLEADLQQARLELAELRRGVRGLGGDASAARPAPASTGVGSSTRAGGLPTDAATDAPTGTTHDKTTDKIAGKTADNKTDKKTDKTGAR
ncbi:MAG: dynamin family protein [Litorilinea sp.]